MAWTAAQQAAIDAANARLKQEEETRSSFSDEQKAILERVQQRMSAPQRNEDDGIVRTAVGDTAAGFISSVPKAAGAIVSLGSAIPYVNEVADPVAQGLNTAGEWLDDKLLSDTQKALNAELQQRLKQAAGELGPDASMSDYLDAMVAQGGEAASFMVENPGQVIQFISTSLPYVLGGGVVGAGAKGLGASSKAAAAIGEGLVAGGAVESEIVKKQMQEGEEGWNTDRLAALPAGVVTGLISRGGASLSPVDIDVAATKVLSGESTDLLQEAGKEALKQGLMKQTAKGALIEGGEETLQSGQEKVFTNIGTDEHPLKDVGGEAVIGGITGAGQGAGVNVMSRGLQKSQESKSPVDATVSELVETSQLEMPDMPEGVQVELPEITAEGAAAGPFVLVNGQQTDITKLRSLRDQLMARYDEATDEEKAYIDQINDQVNVLDEQIAAREIEEAQKAEEVLNLRVKHAETFPDRKDYEKERKAQAEAAREADLDNPETELGAQFVEWRKTTNNYDTANNSKEAKKQFLAEEVGQIEDVDYTQDYLAELDAHARMKEVQANRNPQSQARIQREIATVVQEYNAAIKAGDPELIAAVETKAQQFDPAEWAEAMRANKQGLKPLKKPKQPKKEEEIVDVPKVNTAEQVELNQVDNIQDPVTTPKSKSPVKDELRNYAAEQLGEDWESSGNYDGLAQYAGGVNFTRKTKDKSNYVFKTMVDKIVAEQEAENQLAVAEEAGKLVATNQVEENLIAGANELLGEGWETQFPNVVEAISKKMYANAAREIQAAANDKEQDDARGGAEQASKSALQTDKLKASSKNSEVRTAIIDLFQRMVDEGSVDQYTTTVTKNGKSTLTLQVSKIAKELGFVDSKGKAKRQSVSKQIKELQPYLVELISQKTNAAVNTTEDVKEALRSSRITGVEESAETNIGMSPAEQQSVVDNNEVFGSDRLGPSMSIIKSAGGSQSAVGKNDEADTANALTKPDPIQEKRREEAKRKYESENEALLDLLGADAIEQWASMRSEGSVDASSLSKADAIEWVRTYAAYVLGQEGNKDGISLEELDQTQREIERRYDGTEKVNEGQETEVKELAQKPPEDAEGNAESGNAVESIGQDTTESEVDALPQNVQNFKKSYSEKDGINSGMWKNPDLKDKADYADFLGGLTDAQWRKIGDKFTKKDNPFLVGAFAGSFDAAASQAKIVEALREDTTQTEVATQERTEAEQAELDALMSEYNEDGTLKNEDKGVEVTNQDLAEQQEEENVVEEYDENLDENDYEYNQPKFALFVGPEHKATGRLNTKLKVDTIGEALQVIIETGNVFERTLASRLKPILERNGTSYTVVRNPREIVKMDFENKRAQLQIFHMFKGQKVGGASLFLGGGNGSAILIDSRMGLNNRTVLHEALHAATSAALSSVDQNLPDVTPELEAFAQQLASLREFVENKLDNMSEAELLSIMDDDESIVSYLNAVRDVVRGDDHEFVTWGLTDPVFQEALLKINVGTGSRSQSAFSKFVQTMRNFFSLPDKFVTAFDELVSTTDGLMNEQADLEEGQRVLQKILDAAKFEPKAAKIIEPKEKSGKIKEAIGKVIGEGQVKSAFDTAKFIAKNIKESTKNLNQLVRDYKDVMPSLEVFYTKLLELDKARNELLLRVEGVAVAAREMSDDRLAVVNKFIADSTFYKKWGYDPEIDGLNVKVDPVMERRFNQLSEGEQEVVKTIFSHGEEMRAIKRKLAKQIGAPNLFPQRTMDGPYAPLKRYGDYVVVLESDALIQAQKNAANRPNSKIARDKVEELKANPDHYVVKFFDTMGAAQQFHRANKDKFPNSREAQERNKSRDLELISNSQTFNTILGRIAAVDGVSPAAKDAFEKLVRDMYFMAMDENDARQHNQRRMNRAGFDENMIRSFLSHAHSEASMISHMEYGAEVNEALAEANAEADASRKEKPRAIYNMVERHYVSALTPRRGWYYDLQSRANAITTFYMLTTSLGYHITNATQPGMVTLPMLSGRFGYGKSFAALARGYKAAQHYVSFDSKNMQVVIDLEKSYPKSGFQKYYSVLKELQLRQLLDVGMEQDLNEFNEFDSGIDAINKVGKESSKYAHRFYQAARMVEAYNRISSGVAAYDLAMRNPQKLKKLNMTPTQYAVYVVESTQGNFSRLDAPLLLKEAPPVTVQYRKYQFMMAWFYANALDEAYNGASKEERAIAKKTFGIAVAQAGVFAGATGLPGIGLIMFFWNLVGDDDEPDDDLERAIRMKFKDNPLLADVLSRGVLGSLGVDMSAKLSQANIYSIAPYIDFDPEAPLDSFGQFIAGPSGTVASNMIKSKKYFDRGDDWRGFEQLMPKGVKSISEAVRYKTEGFKLNNGDVIIDPTEFDVVDLVTTAAGIPASKVSKLKFTRGQQYELEQYFNEKSTNLRQRYQRAWNSDDKKEMEAIEKEFDKLQDAKDNVRPFFKDDFKALKRQSMLDLTRSVFRQFKREQTSRSRLRDD